MTFSRESRNFTHAAASHQFWDDWKVLCRSKTILQLIYFYWIMREILGHIDRQERRKYLATTDFNALRSWRVRKSERKAAKLETIQGRKLFHYFWLTDTIASFTWLYEVNISQCSRLSGLEILSFFNQLTSAWNKWSNYLMNETFHNFFLSIRSRCFNFHVKFKLPRDSLLTFLRPSDGVSKFSLKSRHL